MSGFFIGAKRVKYALKTKHLFLMKMTFLRELSNHNTEIVQIRK